jgi:hypothetical protein
MRQVRICFRGAALLALAAFGAWSWAQALVPPEERGSLDAERSGMHDAANIRTVFWNYGMVGDYPPDPGNVDLSVFHSVEVPKGSGMNYSDGITPFVLAKIRQRNGLDSYIMETGFRERQATSPFYNRVMRFEPRPGFFQADPLINVTRSPAISSDSLTWPEVWPDKRSDPDDPGWSGKWNGYFGQQKVADQESYTVMDDNFYDAWDFYPDSTDSHLPPQDRRHGLGLRIEVRGFQWANPQAGNVVFWHYDITNEGTTDYDDNIIFGLYMDSGVGGSAFSCDNIYESDDDNAYYDRTFDQNVVNLVYTWDRRGHGRDLSGNCGRTGYLGYAYLETPGNALDGKDNDDDGITDEVRDGGPGQLIVGQDAIQQWVKAHYDMAKFVAEYGPLEARPGFRNSRWWSGDEDLDWNQNLHDVGADGLAGTGDTGELDGMPTQGEPSFDRTDLNESDQIGLTGFKLNRIKWGEGSPSTEVDGILFYTESSNWPSRLYEQFSDPDPAVRFGAPLASNYNIGFLFASGPFKLKAGKTERFSLALAYGGDLNELRRTVKTVQQIYNANYRFAVPPLMPTLTAESGDRYVRLSWSDVSERGADPVTGDYDFEGYRIYRSSDPEFRDPKVITTGTGSGPLGNGRPIAQFDLADGKTGFSDITVEGVAYYLGNDTGLTHTWTDTTVTNGQLYYYAVTSYDYGSDSLSFYPSENAIAVSRTLRGGFNPPQNVVAVRPEPPVPGYISGAVDSLRHVFGSGTGTVSVQVVNSNLIPEGHLIALTFATTSPESVRANTYALRDSTAHRTLFASGTDLAGLGIGPVGGGLLPVIKTQDVTTIDQARSGFTPESPTNSRLKLQYQPSLSNRTLRPGYPEDISIVFDDAPVDTSIELLREAARPAKFRVVAHGPEGDHFLKFRFVDRDSVNGIPAPDGTLSRPDERIDIVTYREAEPTRPRITWSALLDTLGQSVRGTLVPPTKGDRYELRLIKPFGAADVFTFRTLGARVDADSARVDFAAKPYVVPNPYVGAASFEPERFAVSGRGERRIEFRNIPLHARIRIYTVRGELVETLQQDGSSAGYVPWDLRTKDNLEVAPGLYIFHVDGGGLGKHIGKFAIIK